MHETRQYAFSRQVNSQHSLNYSEVQAYDNCSFKRLALERILPEKELITAYDEDPVAFLFVKAVKMVGIAAKNYPDLIDQLIRKTEVRESAIDQSAMRHLLEKGNKAAARWL